jgi:hypothetical protein
VVHCSFFGIVDHCSIFWDCGSLFYFLGLWIIVLFLGIVDHCSIFWDCGSLFYFLGLWIIVLFPGIVDHCSIPWNCGWDPSQEIKQMDQIFIIEIDLIENPQE